MKFSLNFFGKLSVFNLLLVAVLGVTMRYQFASNNYTFNPKNLIHSHSHFAFSGWVTQTLFLLLLNFIKEQNTIIPTKKYNLVLIANLLCSYGMLIAFSIQGYAAFSILFSTVSLFISYYFGFIFIKDTKDLNRTNPSIIWFKAGIFFNILSSFGTFLLAYLMANKLNTNDFYLASIYFYLHFQYNGWFFFTLIGLLINKFMFIRYVNKLKPIFWGLFITCIITYFLSVLWTKLPNWLYLITAIFTLIQLIYWLKFQFLIKKYFIETNKFLKYIISVIVIFTNLKFLMQLILVIPSVNNSLLINRTIIIAYLHLVLLGIVSLFLIYYLINSKLISYSKLIQIGLSIFIIGIILNEIALFSQGFLSSLNVIIPFINETLLIISIILLLGALIIYKSSLKQS